MDDRRHTLRHFPVVRDDERGRGAGRRHRRLPPARPPRRQRAPADAAQRRPPARFTLGFLAYGAHAELGMPPPRRPTTSTSPRAAGRSPSAATAPGRSPRPGPAGSCCCPTSSTPSAGPTTPSSSSSRSPAPGWSRTSPISSAAPSTGPSTSGSASARRRGRGRSLLAAVEFLARELDRPGGIAETPLAREQLEAFVMTQVLLAVPNSYSDVLEGYVARSAPLPAAGRAHPHGDPRGPAVDARRAGQGRAA